jgi:aspartate/methionine/tyrosine aminotransferase
MANPIYAAMGTSIFEEMSHAARTTGAINLGQGFPDEDGPLDIRQAAADALLKRSNQYPPMLGLPELRQAVADHYRRFHGLEAGPEQVLVTSGATEAIAASLLALISPGDEVLLIQPMYDAYQPLVERAGGIARFARLDPPGWRLTREAIEAALTPATRIVLLNNPLNPAARAFDRAELETLAQICIEHDLIAICDEVWEHLLFDGRVHVPLITLPGMADRTVKIGSAGKIFSMTGWKVGFIVAAPDLHAVIARAHQFLTFTTPPALQAAVAFGLGKEAAHFAAMRARYQASRDRLAGALAAGGYAVLPADGTYFLNVDLRASGATEPDRLFCKRLVEQHRVASIPLSPFYAEQPVDHLVRLCFAKNDDTLDEGARRLIAGLRG